MSEPSESLRDRVPSLLAASVGGLAVFAGGYFASLRSWKPSPDLFIRDVEAAFTLFLMQFWPVYLIFGACFLVAALRMDAHP